MWRGTQSDHMVPTLGRGDGMGEESMKGGEPLPWYPSTLKTFMRDHLGLETLRMMYEDGTFDSPS